MIKIRDITKNTFFESWFEIENYLKEKFDAENFKIENAKVYEFEYDLTKRVEKHYVVWIKTEKNFGISEIDHVMKLDGTIVLRKDDFDEYTWIVLDNPEFKFVEKVEE